PRDHHPFPTRRSSDLDGKLETRGLGRPRPINAPPPLPAQPIAQHPVVTEPLHIYPGGKRADRCAQFILSRIILNHVELVPVFQPDRKSTRLNSSHDQI